MRRLILILFRLYFRYFPIRKGKIPVLLFLDKIRLTKNYSAIAKFDRNIFIKVNLDDWIQKQIFFFGRYEIEKMETLFWRNLIRSGQTIVDVGANIGYYTLQSAVRVGNNGRVYAFEPVSMTYKKLCDNIGINSFDNIVPEKLALSNNESEIEIFVADEKSTGSSSIAMHVNFSGIKETVKTLTMDKYAKNNGIKRIDVIKIDVEGSEPMVIEGMVDVMSTMKPFILIEVLDERLTKVGSSKEKLFDQFNSINYQGYEICNDDSVIKLASAKEGGLILFKHPETELPSNIKILTTL